LQEKRFDVFNNRSQVKGSTFRVKDKEGTDDGVRSMSLT
jgi:hypothetical protein